MKYGFLITIDTTDGRGALVQTIKGNQSILSLIEGRDEEAAADGETWFNRWVLKPSLLPAGTADIPAIGLVGLNRAVPAVVKNEYSQNSTFWSGGFDFRTTPELTREYMQMRLRQLANHNGVTNIWEIIPGDNLGGDLLSHFVPIF